MQESDMMITLFTQKAGIMSVVAKGARHPKSALSAPTHPFVFGQYQISTGESYNRLNNAEIKSSFYHVREDLNTLAYASYFCELTEKALREGQGNKSHFTLIVEMLHLIEKNAIDLKLARVAFEIKLLKSLGYGIASTHCTQCESPLEAFEAGSIFYFSAKEGGAICPNCALVQNDALQGAYKTGHTLFQLIHYLEKKDIRIIAKTQINAVYILKLETLLKAYIDSHLNLGYLKTLSFMDSMITTK